MVEELSLTPTSNSIVVVNENFLVKEAASR